MRRKRFLPPCPSAGLHHVRTTASRCRGEGHQPQPPQPVAKAEASDEEEAESEEDTRDPSLPKSPDHRPIGGSNRRPPEPEGPPPSDRHRERSPRRDRDAGHHRASKHHDSSRRSRKEGRDRRRRGSHQRGGGKHQRLGRLAANPNLPVHRKPPDSFWELSSRQERPLELSQLGR